MRLKAQFSLRLIFLIIAIAAVVAAVIGIHVRLRENDRRVIDSLAEYGVSAHYENGRVISLGFDASAKRRLGDNEISLIGGLSQLQYLDLTNTDISDNGLALLTQCTELDRLFVNDRSISEDACYNNWRQSRRLVTISFIQVTKEDRTIVKTVVVGGAIPESK